MIKRFLFLILAIASATAGARAAEFILQTRTHVATAPGRDDWRVVEATARWDARKTAIVVCDMWQRHWCRGATARVAEMAPRMNALLNKARAEGALIIHCPSGGMAFYEGTPQRRLAQAAPKIALKIPLETWCKLDPGAEGPLPIDDANGGCNCTPICSQDAAVVKQVMDRHQIATLDIKDGDAITDSAEAYYLMRQRGIEHVMLMGVHLNMCVLGRPFAIRQLVKQKLDVVLMRDLTDTMYDSRSRPFVNHFAGTDLMTEHIEKYWCPSVTSASILGGKPARFNDDDGTRPASR
jgi:nicotinamidase-related amidase